ncbi:bifunctional UDP-N-acetylglucosamine diphosphorylase/glucosamine-1-phosphate N-acetyltransferase GlmU [Cryptosporangium phraense]|uniref:Bifunctional protein GlmU n=1 Tax=Cryptosporangium phraense TaxID=2593070 RepID=A0A545AW20_9ACTN|nr:bifunctional UDP-N-acetylglucosamine diphosphorylase/glucosamine-1-phosphate N-acetyltransferase GlmU [Cryptosporangium phraense]TQS45514.1 bifunctional UDP-N-acetylglucosamine diphosphorylase/glucosamine-1-phosphate N-acetyltransferase GlmU [Cryptosporangium phraense]
MTSPARPAAVVILAAGEGTRMKSDTPKVLHELCGRSLVGHVLAAAGALEPAHLAVVVGYQRDRVAAHVTEQDPRVVTAVQDQQLGTGHAVRCALAELPDLDGPVVVLNGDTPLLTGETLQALVATHVEKGNAATVLTASVPDPTGLGRIVRDADGHVRRIVEHRDATPEERTIAEINSGMFAFDAKHLHAMLDRLTTDNDQGQEYLTDVLGLLVEDGHPVAAMVAPDYRETLGCNDRVELAGLRALLRDRLVTAAMRAGATVVDPASVWFDVDVRLGRDVVVHPNVQLRGATVIEDRAEVGPDTTLVDTRVGTGASVVRAHALQAEIGPEASVGPYAYLRPGSVLARKAKVGTYVETKNATIGEGSKVPHLTYVGDATIGEQSNIGASSVFVNYDGVKKYHTVIGDHARTGSDTMFVAPVSVGDGAYTAAGSVITEDVPPGAMAVARSRQRNIEGWVERRRPGTPAAEAAAAARRVASEEGTVESSIPPATTEIPGTGSDH